MTHNNIEIRLIKVSKLTKEHQVYCTIDGVRHEVYVKLPFTTDPYVTNFAATSMNDETSVELETEVWHQIIAKMALYYTEQSLLCQQHVSE